MTQTKDMQDSSFLEEPWLPARLRSHQGRCHSLQGVARRRFLNRCDPRQRVTSWISNKEPWLNLLKLACGIPSSWG